MQVRASSATPGGAEETRMAPGIRSHSQSCGAGTLSNPSISLPELEVKLPGEMVVAHFEILNFTRRHPEEPAFFCQRAEGSPVSHSVVAEILRSA